jgi:long-subunit fatty acid transport protein
MKKEKMMIFAVKCFMVLCFFLTPLAYGQMLSQFASTPNPVGSGARALGMGSAFIAIADDATAASWNPSGLTQLQQAEMSLVIDWRHRIEDNDFENNSEANGVESVSKLNINYLSLSWPFKVLDRHTICSLNYQRLYDFNREWDFTLDLSNEFLKNTTDIEYQQSGSLSALSIAYAIQIIPQLSVGATVNWLTDASKWRESYHESILMTTFEGEKLLSTYDKYDRYSLEGVNFNIGLLWKPNFAWSIGAVFKSPYTADIHHKLTEIPTGGHPITSKELDMPMSYGLGIAYRLTEVFTLSADVYRTHWEDYVRKLSDSTEVSPVTGSAPDEADVEATIQVRIGGEYSVVSGEADRVISIRGGVFYDPAPAKEEPDDYYGFTLGLGLTSGGVQKDKPSGGVTKTKKKFAVDAAYQYRRGDDVGASIIPDYPFSQDVREHMIYSSLIFYF